MPYLLLLVSLFLIFTGSNLAAIAVFFFMMSAISSLDDKTEKAATDQLIALRKRLDIVLRLFATMGIILLITQHYFVELDGSTILYLMILPPLTLLVILNRR